MLKGVKTVKTHLLQGAGVHLADAMLKEHGVDKLCGGLQLRVKLMS